MRALAALLALICVAPVAAQAQERIAEIRIHGNHTTPDADVLAVSGLAVGDEATVTRLAAAEQQLLASKRFAGAEVRRRFLSIDDPTSILVMIVVDERDAVTADTPMPGVLRRLRLSSLWLPILDYRDGYGFTYGARISFVDPLGPRTRVSFPLTWGGERRAAVEVERTFEGGPLTRVGAAAAAYRTVNPHFETPDFRLETSGRIERRFTSWLRAGASARTAKVDFGGTEAWHTAGGADLIFDTRLDPSFPRNAIHATLGWERLAFETGRAGLWSGDIRGYVGIWRSNVLALRAQFDRSNAPLPPSEQPLLGGTESLRGYRTGYRAGDSMAAVSAEVRVPLTSPLNFGRFGVKAFVDAGTTWLASERLVDQRFDHGIGGGVYLGAAAFMMNVDVAWSESGRARTQVGFGVTF